MKLIIFILLTLGVATSCNAQNKEKEKNMEKYDFAWMKEMEKMGTSSLTVKRGDTLIHVNSMTDNGTFCNDYPPTPNFYMIQKKFYPNGFIKSYKKYITNTLFGISKFYNEDGTLNKIVDEDEKFGKIDYEWILKFIEKEGWIDLKTGKGREEINYTGEKEGYIKNAIFNLVYIRKGEKDNVYPIWSVKIISNPETNFYQTLYKIHGETGEVLSKESKELFRTE